ncbi:hypothetical protein RFI_25060, partial [Reticulomyxa filosa]
LCGPGRSYIARKVAEFFSRNWWEAKFDGGILHVSCAGKKLADLTKLINNEQKRLNTLFDIRKDNSDVEVQDASIPNIHKQERVLLILDDLHGMVHTDEDMKQFVTSSIASIFKCYYSRDHLKLLLLMSEEFADKFEATANEAKFKDYYKYAVKKSSNKELLDFLWEQFSCKTDIVGIDNCLNSIRRAKTDLLNNSLDPATAEFLNVCSSAPKLLHLFQQMHQPFFTQGFGIQHISDWCSFETEEELLEDLNDGVEGLDCKKKIRDHFSNTQNNNIQYHKKGVQNDHMNICNFIRENFLKILILQLEVYEKNKITLTTFNLHFFPMFFY